MAKLPVRPMQVRATLVMGEDEPCWCTSGLAWGQCHKGRAEEKPENVHQASVKLRREYERGYCSHPRAPEGCDSGIIRAHTLQRNGTLNRIAKHGHVYAARTMTNGLRTGFELKPEKVGIKQASTFMGFCNKHDTEMFRPIETGDLPLDARTAFLLSFRATAYELYEKRAGLRGLQGLRPDAGRGIMDQERIVNALLPRIIQLELPVADYTAWKSQLDDAFLAEDYSRFRLLAIEFDGILPLASTCVVQPPYGLGGVEIQDMEEEHLEKVAYAITTRGDNSLFVLCWQQGGTAAQTFVDLLLAAPEADLATAAMLVALFYSENTYFDPDWWEGLSESQRAWMVEVLAVGIPDRMRLSPQDAFSPDRAEVRLDFGVRDVFQA